MNPLSRQLRGNLARIAGMGEAPGAVMAWDEAVRISSFEARAILEAVDTIEGLRGALSMGRLTDELVRVLLAQSTIETFDITGRLLDPRRDDEPTIPLREAKP